jgi:flagellar hook assembly protein FlgD
MVTEDQRIERLYNFPNPFSAYTDITFIVTGSQAPDFMTIRIFSVAGRRVRQIDLPPGSVQVGFNRVRWDGRDQDGDDVANGVYFLQVEAKTGDMVLTALERMARIR